MAVLRTVAIVLALVQLVAIVVGLTASEPGAAGELLANTWGLVSIVDLYLALGAVWAWLAWRERSVPVAAAWAVGMVVLGSLAAWAYVALAAGRAGSVEQLLLGDRRAT